MCLTELAKKIDISCVQAFHTSDEIDSMVEAAIRYHFAAAFTLPAFSSYIAKSWLITRTSTQEASSAFREAVILFSRKADRQKNCVKPVVKSLIWL